ncbi:hypothetical protein [Parasegetibacter sp. NRK P23]|uniref:hypothetical protein n=1 Tax=Parasegetibacter sp. NRK P23 TaxID=2942999 RepID=UPI002044B647|nr:hypothetical protein [Parasegetibacter sp. NRK P23]MCM5528952.1 hypothetical protein [Parasegetibacter sp. NRK P23]
MMDNTPENFIRRRSELLAQLSNLDQRRNAVLSELKIIHEHLKKYTKDNTVRSGGPGRPTVDLKTKYLVQQMAKLRSLHNPEKFELTVHEIVQRFGVSVTFIYILRKSNVNVLKKEWESIGSAESFPEWKAQWLLNNNIPAKITKDYFR